MADVAATPARLPVTLALGVCPHGDQVWARKAVSEITVSITDLAGYALGSAEANEILIDTNAAGYGWFIGLHVLTRYFLAVVAPACEKSCVKSQHYCTLAICAPYVL